MQPNKVLLADHTIESAGVDWLTCTATRDAPVNPLQDFAVEVMEVEQRRGNEFSPWKMSGYIGFQCGGARVGVRQDSIIVQLSSDVAREHWCKAYALARNVSRIDAQLTVRFEKPQPYIIKALHRDAIEHKHTCGRPPNRTLINSTLKGDTLYIGQRSSEIYHRAYDKGIEQGIEDAGILLRYEAEFKGDRAKEVASRLSVDPSDATLPAALVSTCFVRQGVRVPASSQEMRLDASSLPPSDVSRKLLWVSKAVAPSIQFLLKHVERDEILKALGLYSE